MPSIPYDCTRTALYQPATRPTLFVAGTSYAPTLIGIECARLAYLRSESSHDDAARLAEALARIGFSAPQPFVGAFDAQAFGSYRASDRLALIAFRGTEPDRIGDLGTDADVLPVAWPESAGKVHQGFARSLRSLRGAIDDWLGTLTARDALLLCGHSLGGALATLGASIWKPRDLVTIGSPRVGDADFVATVEAAAVTRIVDCCDVVTTLPPELTGYRHVGSAVYIDRDGNLPVAPDDAFVRVDHLKARADYTLHCAWRSGAVLLRDLADHAPINYARAMFP